MMKKVCFLGRNGIIDDSQRFVVDAPQDTETRLNCLSFDCFAGRGFNKKL